jgi:hypothetical protein
VNIWGDFFWLEYYDHLLNRNQEIRPMCRSSLLALAVTGLIAVLPGCASDKTAGTPVTNNTAAASVPKLTLACSLAPVAAGFAGTCQVPCSVNALAINFDGVEPKRACSGPARTVNVSLAKTDIANRWLGTMQGVQPEDPTRFEVVPIAGTAAQVGRTPFGCFAVDRVTQTEKSLDVSMVADKQVRPTSQDVAIIDRAIALLPNVDVWNKNDNRQCPPNQQKLSMFCALMQATTEISGGIHYRQPALQAVREVVNTVDQSRVKTHRIMDYNNHPSTTLQEIHSLLKSAQELLKKDMR